MQATFQCAHWECVSMSSHWTHLNNVFVIHRPNIIFSRWHLMDRITGFYAVFLRLVLLIWLCFFFSVCVSFSFCLVFFVTMLDHRATRWLQCCHTLRQIMNYHWAIIHRFSSTKQHGMHFIKWNFNANMKLKVE